MSWRRNPEALTVIAVLLLLFVGIPVSVAFWYFSAFLVYLGMFFLGLIILACIAGVVALFGIALKPWRQPPLAIPATRDGTYIVRGKRIERLVPLFIEEHPIVEESPAPVNHVPVHIDYVAPDQLPSPEQWDEQCYDTNTVDLAHSYEEGLAAESLKAFNDGATSGDKMHQALIELGYEVSIREARKIVKQLKEEKQ